MIEKPDSFANLLCRAQADGLRAAWPELMKGAVWELNQQTRSVSDVINEGLAVERKPDPAMLTSRGDKCRFTVKRSALKPQYGDSDEGAACEV